MIAITPELHTHMLTVNGPTLPATYTGDGVVAVRSSSVNVSYLVRFIASALNTWADCPCKDFVYRSGPQKRPCRHILAAYNCLAQEAMRLAKAA